MSDVPENAREQAGGWRLAAATSLYLREAKDQPIAWYPWGEEAFEVARRSGRPILLDVGAAWCHWCHVMDEGTYSDQEVSRLIGQHFVAVKVDRDENPEVDRRYQRQVNALSGEGGWPLTAFLTAKGETFFGGTYFPPQDGLGRPGFRQVLREIARLWREEPEKVRENTLALANALAHEHAGTGRTETLSASAFVETVRGAILSAYDPVHGGFGFAPKFPHPTAVEFLLWDSFASQQEGSARRALDTLRRMAEGGIYDQLGGGFHRYSVDEGWHVPHFEKMGVDNAALLSAYTAGYRYAGDRGLLDTVKGVAGWIRETLEDPAGGFGASQDADNAPGDDGGYFTWTRGEMKALLEPDELRVATRYFGVGSEGRMPHDPERSVLFRLMTPAEAAEGTGLAPAAAERTLALAVEKLRAGRGRRPAPQVDRALYANLNGAFARAFVAASAALGDPTLLTSAQQAVDRFLAHAYRPERGVGHRLDSAEARGFGHLEDQAEFAWGLVELAGATLEPRYLRTAEELYTLISQGFRVDGMPLRDLAPGLYDGLTVGALDDPSYPVEDMPQRSANGTILLGLLRLSSLTGEEKWRTEARELLSRCIPRLERAGLFVAGIALAAGVADVPPARIVIEGTEELARDLEATARRAWHPNLWVFRGTPPAPFSLPEELTAASQAPRTAGRALVCWGTRCAPPVTDVTTLRETIRKAGATLGS